MRFGATLFVICVVGVAYAAEEGAPGLDDTQRFLATYCVDCHSGDEPPAEVAVDRLHEAGSVVRQRKVWESALRMVQAGGMPPEEQPQPTAEEVAAFTSHVRAAFDYADRHAKPNPGRVTMRRLNRAEYRNTIRDLIGVDFDPTEEFPSDNIGYGFDNIGDVLTLSPMLMERYLAAADSIARRAIFPYPPDPPVRRVWSRQIEPTIPEDVEVVEEAEDAEDVEEAEDTEDRFFEDGWRRISTGGLEPVETGPLHADYPWQEDAEYVFRTRIYAKSAAPVRVAVLIYGDELPETASEDEFAALAGEVPATARLLKILEVTADTRDDAETLEVPVPPMPRWEGMKLALVKPSDGEPPAEVVVERLELEGPLDTRPASHYRLLGRSDEEPETERTRETLRRFMRRAYRRPPTDDELYRMVALVESVVADGENWESGMQLAIQATLCSPKFLFRVELDDRPESAGAQALDEFQLASRLSYFLWNSMPDDALLDAAERNELAATLEAQTLRMLADPKSKALVESFAPQWLQIQRIATIAPDGVMFPNFDDRLRAAMLEETSLFFESVMREDRSIMDLIDADYTFLNERLANHYGINAPDGEPIVGDAFRRVSLPERQRGGLLTQASVLTVTSNPTRTSPVKRGRWALEQILGEPPPPPPPDVPDLPEDEQAVSSGSIRERMEMHRKNPACANCHREMDAIGFAFENYDAIGAYREKDGRFEIDPAGEFADGTRFRGAQDLKRIIAQRRTPFARCLTEKMLTYALGRGTESYDRPVVERIVGTLEANEYRFSTLVAEIVKSDPFRKRRGAATLADAE
ncbi:DUF1592 domain-containing protein [Candidatus Poribacteria bacterium]|nr:DUF1592 domain-containing protein [Candidatus Poribacteria bacterium]